MLTLEEAAALLGVDVNEVDSFDVPDRFNEGNRINGYLCRRSDHRYGALVICMVNDVAVEPQVIYCTPKLHYPFGRTEMEERKYHFPKKIRKVEVYEKLDGTNILAYVYKDAAGKRYRTFKTRLTATVGDNRFGAHGAMWDELLKDDTLRLLTDERSMNGVAYSFEMFGYRNPHLIVYKDIALSARLLFIVHQDDASVHPPSDAQYHDWTHHPSVFDDAMLFGSQWVLKPYAILETPQDLIKFYEEKRAWAEAQNKSIGEDAEKQIEGTEGFVFYTQDEDGRWEMWKCKPEGVEDLHWTQGNSVPMSVIIPTVWNALESCPGDLTPEYVRQLLLEEFTGEQVGKSETRIGKAVAYVNSRIKLQQRVREAYAATGLSWETDGKGPVMRAMAPSFDRNDMKKVFQALQEMGIAK